MIRDIVGQWAKKHHVQFVGRTSGVYTTDTVSQDALEDLVSSSLLPPSCSLCTSAMRPLRQRRCPTTGRKKALTQPLRSCEIKQTFRAIRTTWLKNRS